MGITLNNTVAGGSTNITLDYVIVYDITRSHRYAEVSIPAKSSPTVDVATYTVNPSLYRISANITNAQKAILETFSTERTYACKLSDGLLSNKDVRTERVGFTARPGYVDYPWMVTLELKATDH